MIHYTKVPIQVKSNEPSDIFYVTPSGTSFSKSTTYITHPQFSFPITTLLLKSTTTFGKLIENALNNIIREIDKEYVKVYGRHLDKVKDVIEINKLLSYYKFQLLLKYAKDFGYRIKGKHLRNAFYEYVEECSMSMN